MKGLMLIFYFVIIVFIIGFLLYLIIRVLKIMYMVFIDVNKGNYIEVVYNFLIRFYMINLVVNFFIYSIIYKWFR